MRDRPFNLQGGGGLWFSFSSRNIFSENKFNFFFLQSAKKKFQNLTLGYMTKTLNQIFFCSSTKIRIFFQQHWESEYFFRKDPSLTYFNFFYFDGFFFSLWCCSIFVLCFIFVVLLSNHIYFSPCIWPLYNDSLSNTYRTSDS